MSSIEDRWEDADPHGPEASCLTCIFKHANAATCLAFPLGIPAPILDGVNLHHESYPGDGGIIYVPALD